MLSKRSGGRGGAEGAGGGGKEGRGAGEGGERRGGAAAGRSASVGDEGRRGGGWEEGLREGLHTRFFPPTHFFQSTQFQPRHKMPHNPGHRALMGGAPTNL